ncbi:MAG: tetratricopeptide repeat protein, partial [Acidobacteriota bacterium]
MIFRILALAFTMAQLAPPSSPRAGLEELARSESWEKILQVANRRAHQLPLSAEQSLIAAQAAHELGDIESERHFLRVAAGGDDQDLARLAEVQVAEILNVTNPDLAVELALPSLRGAPSWQVRDAATASATRALTNNVGPDQRRFLENVASKLPRSLRRRLELGLALSDEQGKRRRLETLLAGSTRDLVALEAADQLAQHDKLSAEEKWLVAKTLYRHALYGEAVPLLDGLASVKHSSIPGAEVAYLRGRCAFRQGRWEEAISWYQKAISRTRNADRQANLEVHIGRCYELSEQMDEAVAAAQRAVRLKTTDDRRLFLARLRLRRSEPELAARGIAHLRGRTARARGELMLGAYALAHGEEQMARRRLSSVRRQPWIGPAAVLTARLDSEDGAVDEAVRTLERNAARLDAFWAAEARAVMATLSASSIEAWRSRQQEEVRKSTGSSRWRALGRWGALETDLEELAAIRLQVSSACGLSGRSATPTFPLGLAARLWVMGLEREAIRWDPSGVPRGNAVDSAWSAERMLAFGMPWRALR